MHPDDFESYKRDILPKYSSLKTEGFIENEYRMKHKNGSYCYFSSREFVYKFDIKGDPEQILGIITNLTPQRQAEKKVAETYKNLSFFAENINEILWVLNDEFKYTYVSPSVKKLLGYTLEEYMSLKFEHLFTPGSYKIVNDALRQRINNKANGIKDDTNKYFEVEMYHKNGTIGIFSVVTTPVYENNNDFRGVIGITKDISDEIRIRNKIQESEERYKSIFQNSLTAIFTMDDKGAILDINDEFVNIFGYTKDEIKQMNVIDIFKSSNPDIKKRFDKYLIK